MCNRPETRADLSQAIDRGLYLYGKLNAAMNNKYTRDPVKLAAWNTASRIERAPRRPTKDDTDPTNGNNPTNGDGPKKS